MLLTVNARSGKNIRVSKELLTAEEYAQARASVNSSFYTPPEVVRGVYKALEQFGFQKGKVLEPAMGIWKLFSWSSGKYAGKNPSFMVWRLMP